MQPLKLEDEVLGRIETIALKLLEDLAHTPVRAVGVNLQFIDDNPRTELLDQFAADDTDQLSDLGWRTEATEIKRRLKKGDATLNFSATLSEQGKLILDFNFHQDVDTPTGAIQFIRTGIVQQKQVAIDLVEKLYGSNFSYEHA
jgi:hypothetical protein